MTISSPGREDLLPLRDHRHSLTMDLRKSLQGSDLLSQHLGMNRGSITILNPEASEIHIEVAHGISAAGKIKGRYRLGEGITGRVIESGKPIAVPDITTEPLFLSRTGARAKPEKGQISLSACPSRKAIG
jgi:Nif-specific regulatory protein